MLPKILIVIFKFKLKNPGYKLTVDSLPFQVSFKKVPMLSICLSILVLLLPNFIIIWFYNLSILSVPDEGYSETHHAH